MLKNTIFFKVLALSTAPHFAMAWQLLHELTVHLALKAITHFAIDFTDVVRGTVWLGFEDREKL